MIGGGIQNRALAATGLRATDGVFGAVDDTAHSTLFDINRIRHVVEPEVNLFASAENVDRDDLFIYDQDVDAINDISGGQLGLCGKPGRPCAAGQATGGAWTPPPPPFLTLRCGSQRICEQAAERRA